MASINEFHRNITSEKVMMTMKEKAKAGYYPCMAPVGYKNITNPNPTVERMGQKSIVVDPHDGPLVKEAFKLYASGNYNVYELNDIMFEKGLQTKHGGKRSDSQLYNTLKNKFFIGEVNWGGIHVKRGKHEPLISEEVFNQVQGVMASQNKHTCRRHKFSWLLSGFLRCYTHGCRYTAEWHLNKSKAYYHCTNKSGCGKYIEIGKLEDMVADKFRTLEFNPSFIEKVIGKAKLIFYERRKTYEGKRKECINQRTAYEAKRKVAEEKLFAKVISDDVFTRVKNEINQELENIDGRMIELEKQRNVNIDVAQEILNLTKNIYDSYQKASPALKRQYLGFFWDNFEIADGLIIKSNLSLLFAELLRLEQASQKHQKTQKPIASNMFIKSNERCAQLESNQRPTP
jgi:site-specific DNA recombinase